MTCSHDSNGHNASTQADTEKVRDQEHHSTIIKEEKKALFSIIQELMTHVQIVSKSIQTMTITSTVTSETIVQSDITGDIIENMRGSISFHRPFLF